ncbi:MAG: fatty acid desaturase, partial [Acidimicrobiia bacterium]
MRLIPALVVAAILSQTAVFATTVYLHRCLAHRALAVHPWVALIFRAYLWLTTGIVPRAWVAVHRKHHAFSDTPQDPHSPVVLGFWAVQLGNLRLYQATIRGRVTVPKYSRDLAPDPLDQLAFDRGMLGLAIGTPLLVLLLGWQTALVAAGVHAVAYLAISSGVNAIGHT